VARYQNRVSGPLLDRIELRVEVERVHWSERQEPGESSDAVAERVAGARGRLRETASAELETGASALLEQAVDDLGLSMRGLRRSISLATTIAALDPERPPGSTWRSRSPTGVRQAHTASTPPWFE